MRPYVSQRRYYSIFPASLQTKQPKLLHFNMELCCVPTYHPSFKHNCGRNIFCDKQHHFKHTVCRQTLKYGLLKKQTTTLVSSLSIDRPAYIRVRFNQFNRRLNSRNNANVFQKSPNKSKVIPLRRRRYKKRRPRTSLVFVCPSGTGLTGRLPIIGIPLPSTNVFLRNVVTRHVRKAALNRCRRATSRMEHRSE